VASITSPGAPAIPRPTANRETCVSHGPRADDPARRQPGMTRHPLRRGPDRSAAGRSAREGSELNSVVAAEFALHSVRHHAHADKRIGHDRAPPGSGTETATGWGSRPGRSSGPNRRKPTVRSRLASRTGGSPHSGHVTREAAAAGVKRSRQPGQHTWVITDPFNRSRKDESRPSPSDPTSATIMHLTWSGRSRHDARAGTA
jgi:hypothetical protein